MYHVRFRGSHYEIGLKWGTRLLKYGIFLLDHVPFEISQERRDFSEKCRPFYEKWYPEVLEDILHATKRLSNLITNMLKLNKLEKQTIRPVPKQYDLCAQLCDCALQFEDVWEKKGLEFEVDMEERRTIEADPGLLELVWTNLLSNAVKFTPAGGTITLTEYCDEAGITVIVSDTGCGMNDEVKQRIFDKFYQGDTSHATEGNGLGLALVKRILELSDGHVFVESQVGKGSTFTVRLRKLQNENENGSAAENEE